VIGSAGSAEKVAYLTGELGFDAAFNYKDGPVADQLAKAAPQGLDVYFDNVGGEHLEAAIGAMNVHGRIAVCGAISQYNREQPAPGPRNLGLFIGRRITMRGFLVRDHVALRDQFAREVGGWLREGRIRFRETVVDGIENAPAAFLGMLAGDNIGKMLVRIPEEPAGA
jgi:NADPH-dependent curcumin reductase CurA